MVAVTGMVASRALAIEDLAIVDAEIVGNNLILHKADGTFINAGDVRGIPGDSNLLVTELGNAVDLNTITTPGSYSQSSTVEAAAGTNYPPPKIAGMLTVTSNGSNMIWQKYHTYNGTSYGNGIWTRTSYNGTWSSWSGTRGGIWQDLSLTSDWVPYNAVGGTYQQPQYRVDGNVFRLRGLAKKTTAISAASTIANVGTTYAPLANEIFGCVTSQTVTSGAASAGTAHTHTLTNYTGRVDVSTAGVISLQASALAPLGANGWVSLDGMFWDWVS